MFRQVMICPLMFVWTLLLLPSSLATHSLAFVRRAAAVAEPSSSCRDNDNPCWYIPRGGEIQNPSSTEELDALIENAKDKLVVIYFYSSDDDHDDETISSLYQELSQRDEFAAVHFLQINNAQQHAAALAAKYQVTGFPTFLFVKNGTVLTEIVGKNLAQATLYDWIQLLLPQKDPKQE